MEPSPAAATDVQAEIAAKVVRWLRCPATREPLSVVGDQINCPASGFRGSIREAVALMMPETSGSFFDDKYQFMQRVNESEGEWTFCYAQQTALLATYLRKGMLVLDVGCGPELSYDAPPGVDVVGLEPSFYSIRANPDLALRVFGSAFEIPMANAAVDAVVCFYSLHHMTGTTVRETLANLSRAFQEFGRVLKPGGHLFVFEMTPISPFAAAQRLGWNILRRGLGRRLDMYFLTASELAAMGQSHLPPGAALEKIFFGISAFTSFAPIFSLPRFKVPRILFPLDAKLYKWRMPGG